MKILLLGGSGLVGSSFLEQKQTEFEIEAPTHIELDILNLNQVSEALKKSPAEVVINCIAFTNVDGAEEEKDDTQGLVYKLNVLAVSNLAKICADNKKHLIHLSTDYVFDGAKEDLAYQEDDKPNPVNWYGMTKYLGEQEVLTSGVSFTIVRIEMPYSKSYEGKKDFARFFLQKLKNNEEIIAINDQQITPVFVPDAVNAISKLVAKKSSGIYHVASSDALTPFAFAQMLSEQTGVDKNLIKPTTFSEFNAKRVAKRPKNSWLDTSKFKNQFGEGILKTNQEGMKEFLA